MHVVYCMRVGDSGVYVCACASKCVENVTMRELHCDPTAAFDEQLSIRRKVCAVLSLSLCCEMTE